MDDSPPTSLDRLETTEHRFRTPTAIQARMIAGGLIQWKHVISSFAGSDDDQLIKRAARINECTKHPAIKLDETGRALLSLARCRDRLCPHCARHRGYQAAKKSTDLIRRMNAPRFLTLTRAHSEKPLVEQVDELMSWFRELRKTPLWKTKVTGGIYTLELTRNQKRNEWHPHLHIVFDGQFLPHSDVRDAWQQITETSTIIHLRKVHDCKAAADYIADYIAKAPGLKNWQRKHVCEFATALHSRRMLNTFGNMHGKSPSPSEPKESIDHSSVIAPLEKIMRARDERNPLAMHAIQLIEQLGGQWCRVLGCKPSSRKKIKSEQRNTLLKQLGTILLDLTCELYPHSRESVRRARQSQHVARPQPPPNLFSSNELPY